MESICSAAFLHIFPPRHAPSAMRLSPSPFRQRTDQTHDAPSRRRRPRLLRKSVNSPCLGDADRVCSANRSIPHWRRLAKCPDFVSARTTATPAPLFSAGVQAMRARICSAFSCDMFARVVWLRLRRAQNRRLSLYPLSHALATHGLHD